MPSRKLLSSARGEGSGTHGRGGRVELGGL